MRVWPSFSVALEEQELEGEFRIPAGAALGYGHILVGFNAHVYRLLTDFEDASHTAAPRNRPAVAAAGLPVGRDDWRMSERS